MAGSNSPSMRNPWLGMASRAPAQSPPSPVQKQGSAISEYLKTNIERANGPEWNQPAGLAPEPPPLTHDLSEGSQHMSEANTAFDEARASVAAKRAQQERAAEAEHQQRSKEMATERARRSGQR